jgi:hypothetical protein
VASSKPKAAAKAPPPSPSEAQAAVAEPTTSLDDGLAKSAPKKKSVAKTESAPSAGPASQAAGEKAQPAGVGEIRQLLDRANAARDSKNQSSEIAYLRMALAQGASGDMRREALERLCNRYLDAKSLSGATPYCSQLYVQFPKSKGAIRAKEVFKY